MWASCLASISHTSYAYYASLASKSICSKGMRLRIVATARRQMSLTNFRDKPSIKHCMKSPPSTIRTSAIHPSEIRSSSIHSSLMLTSSVYCIPTLCPSTPFRNYPSIHCRSIEIPFLPSRSRSRYLSTKRPRQPLRSKLLGLEDSNENINDLILEKSLTHRNPSAQLIRYTVFDPEGNVQVVSGEFKRNEFLSKHGLLPRDLRKLDMGISNIVPSILVRQNSILINLLHIRALIKADMVILFDVYGSSESKTQSVFMYDLEHKLRFGSHTMGGLAYEFRALEAIFISVVTSLDAEMHVHTTVINGILAELEDDIDREKLRHLLIQSKKLSAFLQKATLVRDTIDELLESDEDLAGLYLTAKKKLQKYGNNKTASLVRDNFDELESDKDPTGSYLKAKKKLQKYGNIKTAPLEEDHSEAEMLLESYYKHCDEIVQTVGNLVSNIRSTEEIINIILDSNRNNLMLLDLKFQIGTLGLGAGTFLASFYGMNLQNFIEESDWGFWAISGGAVISSVIVIIYGLRHLRSVQRITMMDRPKKL